eukprot:symbB.v1.2.001350.t1/scaffold69.1/size353428/5
MQQSATTMLGLHDFLPLSSVSARDLEGGASTEREILHISVEQPEHVNLGLLDWCFWRGRMVHQEACPSCGASASTEKPNGEEMTRSALQLTRIRVKGKGFLKHMVRRIVGLLVEVGTGVRAPWATFDEAHAMPLDARPAKAPAHGLWLEEVVSWAILVKKHVTLAGKDITYSYSQISQPGGKAGKS